MEESGVCSFEKWAPSALWLKVFVGIGTDLAAAIDLSPMAAAGTRSGIQSNLRGKLYFKKWDEN